MPFRSSFDCLWCGRAWQAREPSDLEGWAGLCPDCLGRAQGNAFLRYRLKTALAERARGAPPGSPEDGRVASQGADHPDRGMIDGGDGEMGAYYAARAPEYDDWYLRRGRYSRGPVRDLAWATELDEATRWLDAQPMAGEIVELAAGTGWWSPLLAQKGTLTLTDINEEPLDRARQRLVAHGLRAHLHVADAWAEPDRQVDAVFCGFWLSHVTRGRLLAFLELVGRWLRPGGTFTFIDSLPDPESGAVDHDPVTVDGTAVRRLADGREFRVPKVHYAPAELSEALARAGFASVKVDATARFFLLGVARARAYTQGR